MCKSVLPWCRLTLAMLLISLPAVAAERKKKNAAADDDAAAPAQAVKIPADLKVVKDIVYKQVGDRKLDLWLIPPKEKKFEKSPLVLYIHGGGWSGGDKTRLFQKKDSMPVVEELSARGYTFATVEYRLTEAGKVTAMDSVADCLDALAYLAANADKYGIDPNRIGLTGGSAGGHLSLMTALAKPADYPCDPSLNGTRPRIRCCVSFYPSVSMNDPKLMEGSNFANPQRMVPILGGLREEKPDVAHKLSPIELLGSDCPPLLLVHGDQDKTLSVHHTEAFVAKAKEMKLPVEAIIVKGAGHGLSGNSIDPPMSEINRQTAAFFEKHLN